jgi:hypothetical protein
MFIRANPIGLLLTPCDPDFFVCRDCAIGHAPLSAEEEFLRDRSFWQGEKAKPDVAG